MGHIKNMLSFKTTIVLINIILLVMFVLAIEGGARLYIYYSRGVSTAGLPERRQYLRYKPFVMYGKDFDHEMGGNLDDIKQKRAHNPYVVLLLGGSTAAGFPLKVLQKAFDDAFPERLFKIINFAHAGYIARQELVVAAVWGIQLKPDLLISLDGANDLINRLREDKAGTFYLDQTYRLALQRPFLSPFVEILRHSQFRNGLSRLFARKNVKGFDECKDSISIFIEAQHSLNIIAKGIGAKRLMILQPFHSYKKPLTKNEAAFTHYKFREKVVIKLYDALDVEMRTLSQRDEVLYIDGRFIYEGMKEDIFTDDVHFRGDLGYKIVADNIVKLLVKQGL